MKHLIIGCTQIRLEYRNSVLALSGRNIKKKDGKYKNTSLQRAPPPRALGVQGGTKPSLRAQIYQYVIHTLTRKRLMLPLLSSMTHHKTLFDYIQQS